LRSSATLSAVALAGTALCCSPTTGRSYRATIDAAVNAIEELEETAKLFLLLRNTPTRPLNKQQIDELNALFGTAGQAG
jgi:hypothetical protein